MIYDKTPRLIKLGDALSQFFNVLTVWDNSSTTANESMSGRAFRLNLRREKFINFVVFWEKNHCEKAFNRDRQRAMNLLNAYPLQKDFNE